jgi:transcriptional regulator with XRE-family HTH domain
MIGYGERLRALRKENQLTLEGAARIVGVAKSTYAGYETEFRKPSLDKISLFADFYQVSVDYLLCLTDQQGTEEDQSHNAKTFLSKGDLHWDGVPLSEEELHYIRDFLETIAEKKSKQKSDKKFG